MQRKLEAERLSKDGALDQEAGATVEPKPAAVEPAESAGVFGGFFGGGGGEEETVEFAAPPISSPPPKSEERVEFAAPPISSPPPKSDLEVAYENAVARGEEDSARQERLVQEGYEREAVIAMLDKKKAERLAQAEADSKVGWSDKPKKKSQISLARE